MASVGVEAPRDSSSAEAGAAGAASAAEPTGTTDAVRAVPEAAATLADTGTGARGPAGAGEGTAQVSATTSASEDEEPTARDLRWPSVSRFVAGEAPLWPFRGLVQLSPSWNRVLEGRTDVGWVLRYWVWESETLEHREVPLPGLEVECLGQVALVSHGERGVEVGGAPGAVSGGFWVRWGGVAEAVEQPSGALLEELARPGSNAAVAVEGDVVRVGEGSQQRAYLMRDPVRGDGERWRVQARHDGELFVMTVHPAHLGCLSGVSWLSMAGTGELVFCGANTAATAFVAPAAPDTDLVLPDPAEVGTYLSCPAPMDLTRIGSSLDRPQP